MSEIHIHVENPIGELQGVPFGGVLTDTKLGALQMLGRCQFTESHAEVDFAQDTEGNIVAIVKRDDGTIAGRFRINWADLAVGLMCSLDDIAKAGLAHENTT